MSDESISIEKLRKAQQRLILLSESTLRNGQEGNVDSQYAAALRGKARGYREAADMIDVLVRTGKVKR